MARALGSYIPWFKEQAKVTIPEIRELREVLSRRVTKNLIEELQRRNFRVENRNDIESLLEKRLDWLKWIRQTHSWLISQTKGRYL